MVSARISGNKIKNRGIRIDDDQELPATCRQPESKGKGGKEK
jgi:hypothetical protein